MKTIVHVTDDDTDGSTDYAFDTIRLPKGAELSQCQLCRALLATGDEREHAAWHHRLRMAHTVAGAGIFGAFMGRSVRDTI